ncbi:YqfQ family protein [Rossellomorea aquimaris]|uniref:YqfQ family protein n=1 Tax=Rossellomorea aquimaris TaxID=189382 RepID=UPI001CD5B2A2|nr:YqfQ family protein [Rossellomorea aquimaris]MCA1054860.1 YqfQ family protein [Rossellomorea aquimaris]
MPPRRRMRMQDPHGGSPFGMLPRQSGRSPFGMRQQGDMRNPFGTRPQNPPPLQIGQQMNRFTGHQGPPSFQGMNGGRGKARGGGLLSKLLKKGDRGNQQGGGLLQQFSRDNSAGAVTGFERGPGAAAGASTLGSLLNPGNISSFLSNTQQVLNTAQQFGPMIQQYGPMVKNLPALWKLYRGFKDLSSDESTPKEDNEKGTEPNEEVIKGESGVKEKGKKGKKKNVKEVELDDDSEQKPPRKKTSPGTSKPKLYI